MYIRVIFSILHASRSYHAPLIEKRGPVSEAAILEAAGYLKSAIPHETKKWFELALADS